VDREIDLPGWRLIMSASAWDEEYRRAGIPSSYREEPSAAVEWALESWARARGGTLPLTALDVGCGTARNAVYMARRGITVTGFDSSPEAIRSARVRASEVEVELLVHDLAEGLPAASGGIDLVTDVFVYKHQIAAETRRAYRADVRRVLSDRGGLLLYVAEPDDGYYRSCPRLDQADAGAVAIIDPALGAGSVLFTLYELVCEMADCFELEMAWRKQVMSEMYGALYDRRLLATLWTLRPTP
jgi:SAM-dependent methyltransferase